MEFSEIGEKFEGLTADQVYNLAKFGKEILEINGSVTLARAKASLELDHQCWGEHKTLLGLTGVNIDDYCYGLKGAQEIIVYGNED